MRILKAILSRLFRSGNRRYSICSGIPKPAFPEQPGQHARVFNGDQRIRFLVSVGSVSGVSQENQSRPDNRKTPACEQAPYQRQGEVPGVNGGCKQQINADGKQGRDGQRLPGSPALEQGFEQDEERRERSQCRTNVADQVLPGVVFSNFTR